MSLQTAAFTRANAVSSGFASGDKCLQRTTNERLVRMLASLTQGRSRATKNPPSQSRAGAESQASCEQRREGSFIAPCAQTRFAEAWLMGNIQMPCSG